MNTRVINLKEQLEQKIAHLMAGGMPRKQAERLARAAVVSGKSEIRNGLRVFKDA